MSSVPMAVRRAATVFGHELRTLWGNPRLTLFLFGIPVVLTLLVNLTLNFPGEPPDKLGIQDRDGTTLSRKVAAQLQKWPNLRTSLVPATEDPAKVVEASPDELVVVLPAGLETSVLEGQPMALRVTGDRRGQNTSQQDFVAVNSAGTEISSIATAVAVARANAARNHQDEQLAAQTAEANALRNFRLNRLRVGTTWLGRSPVTTFSKQALFATGEGVGLMEFVGMMLAFSMVHDREHGRLTRLLWTRLRLTELVLAKGLTMFLLVTACMALILLVSALVFGMGTGPSLPLLFVITLAVGFSVAGYSMLFVGLGHWAEHVVQVVGVVTTVLVSAIGGSVVPSEGLPGIVKAVGHITPNAWAEDAYHALLFHDKTGGSELWVPIAALIGLGLLQGVVGARLLVYSMKHAH